MSAGIVDIATATTGKHITNSYFDAIGLTGGPPRLPLLPVPPDGVKAIHAQVDQLRQFTGSQVHGFTGS